MKARRSYVLGVVVSGIVERGTRASGAMRTNPYRAADVPAREGRWAFDRLALARDDGDARCSEARFGAEVQMKVAELFTTNTHQSPRVRDDELDLFGLTHPGKVRKENEDHFLAATVHPEVIVHATSLPNADQLPLLGERIATIVLVADGVGGQSGGSLASQIATEAVTRYVSSTLRCYHAA